MITATAYVELRSRLAADGWVDEYLWSENVQPPVNADSFFSEYAWVVISSGIKNQVARVIWDRVQVALADGKPVLSAYRHPGKAAAIQLISDERAFYFDGYQAADDKIAFIADLPWIGPITKWHLAKNYGIDCAKPDRHLARLAAAESATVDDLCRRLARATGDRIATVDLILWRACNLGWL